MATSAQQPPLPFRDKLLYAQGSLGANVVFQTLAAWLLFFYAPPEEEEATAFITIGVAGALLAAGRLLEAFDDPVIGYWSDVTRSRWGRRVPFILFGSPVLGVAFVLLWFPPVGQVSPWNALYFFVVLQLLFAAYTVVRGPYAALLPEIARTSADRVSISAWEVLFGAIGAALALVGAGLLIEFTSFQVMGATLAVVAVVSQYVALLGVRGHTRDAEEGPGINLWQAVRATFTNDQFLAYVPAYMLFSLAQAMLTAAIPFLVSEVLVKEHITVLGFELGEGGSTSVLLAVFIGAVMLTLPLIQGVARRFGKRRIFGGALLTTALYMPLMYFVGFIPGIPSFPQAFFLLGLGLTMSGFFVLPNALMADVIDYDAIRTGLRREAIYFGVQGTLQRIAFSLAALLLGLLFEFLGNTGEDPLGIRLVGPISGAAVLLGWFIFARGYWLPDHVTPEVVTERRREVPKGSAA